MEIKTGIDLVYLPQFQKAVSEGGVQFLQRVYRAEELERTEIAYLAGVFAAKEAVIKALAMNVDSWHAIKITQRDNGAPCAEIITSLCEIAQSSLSITHAGDYAIAHFTAITTEV